MKMPSSLASPVTFVVVACCLALPTRAQPETSPAAREGALQSTPAAPASRPPAPPPSGGETAQKSDAGGTPSPGASVQTSDDFAQTDTDRDGRISAKEYAASPLAAVALVAAGERHGTEAPHGGFSFSNNEARPDQSKFFRRLDTDGDGYLSRGELEAGKK